MTVAGDLGGSSALEPAQINRAGLSAFAITHPQLYPHRLVPVWVVAFRKGLGVTGDHMATWPGPSGLTRLHRAWRMTMSQGNGVRKYSDRHVDVWRLIHAAIAVLGTMSRSAYAARAKAVRLLIHAELDRLGFPLAGPPP